MIQKYYIRKFRSIRIIYLNHHFQLQNERVEILNYFSNDKDAKQD